jgi:serine/threonine-protein kinase
MDGGMVGAGGGRISRSRRPGGSVVKPATTDLSPELEAAAARRLGGLCLTLAGVTAVLRSVEILTGPETPLDVRIRWGLMAVSVVMSLALFAAIAWRRVSARRALQLGLLWQVALAGFVSVAFHAATTAGVELRGWTPIAVWALLYPVVVPTPTRRVIVATLATAAMDPLGLWINRAIGPADATAAPWSLLVPTAVICVAAPIVARVVYQLNVAVKRAKEMGSYQLMERLGAGGMGEVWRAEHRMLARPAALKLIKPELLGSDARSRADAIARFTREARATAALTSTNTVSVYDFGVTDDGAFYYVMELLDGLNLDALVRRHGPLEPARAAFLFSQICHSLAEAHGAGLIHRDIKPANIFVCRLGRDVDLVKVLDFGLVKHLDGDQTATFAGSVLGTPAYIAPEIALGHANVDGRADIYAMGCVAYWLLTGQPVFESGTAVGLMLAHVQTLPTLPSLRTEAEIPQGLETLVMACLAKQPSDRPQTVEEIESALQDVLNETPWSQADSRAWWARRPSEPVAEPRDLDRDDTRTVLHVKKLGSQTASARGHKQPPAGRRP